MSDTSSPQRPGRVDPREQGPKPEYPQPPIDRPGSIAEMNPAADHGEESYHGLARLTGKVALVTGGDSGIGRAVAIAFAREGADVVIGHLPEEERDARDTRAWIERAGRRARFGRSLPTGGGLVLYSACHGQALRAEWRRSQHCRARALDRARAAVRASAVELARLCSPAI